MAALRIGGCLIRKRRRDCRMTQQEVSDRCERLGVNISTTLLSMYENNVKVCNNFRTLKAISIILDCHIDDLYESFY